MMRAALFVGSALFAVFVLISSCAARPPQHDRDFWRAIAKDHYAVPDHESADALAHDLSALLASPDPELRDDLAYSILAQWIYRRDTLSTPTLLAYRRMAREPHQWTRRSRIQFRPEAFFLGPLPLRDCETGSQSSIPGRGPLPQPGCRSDFLSASGARPPRIRRATALDPRHRAHRRLARRPRRQPAAQNRRSHHHPQRHRFAPRHGAAGLHPGRARSPGHRIVSVIRRKDFAPSTFDPWLARFDSEDRDVWTAITVDSLARYQNHSYMLQALTVRISLEGDSPQMAQYRERVLAVLAKR